MTRPILVGLALRDDDAAPLALARELAALSGAPLALATVFPFDSVAPIATPAYAIALREEWQRTIDEVAAGLDGEVTTYVEQGGRAGELHHLAERLGALAVVVGSSHRGTLGRVWAGDVAAGLLHGAPCPVAVAPRGYTGGGFARVGVAYAATPEGREAATAAFGVARRVHATVQVVSVVEPSVFSSSIVVPGWVPPVSLDAEELDAHALGAAQRIIAELGAGVTASAEVRRGPVVATLAEATASLDLLVCGSRGYGAARSALAGGVSRGLAHSCACPLLLVPRRTAPEAAALWQDAATVAAR